MKMSDESYLAAMVFNTVYVPALKKLSNDHNESTLVNNLRLALQNADAEQPGFLFEFLKRLASKCDIRLNFQECMLRMQATLPAEDFSIGDAYSNRNGVDPLYQELSYRAVNLRKVLSRIPDEMSDRRTFLETIKEIASCIKKLLDAANTLIQTLPERSSQSAALEQRKREFVKYSKRFSNTLKDYFKGEDPVTVYANANQLIYQTSLMIKVVPERVMF
uniref:Programmed cell death protein 10 n=1 Tax=Romanomermis culicivorax TaxID=13658 RepID=A0A915K6J9_ROMCU